MLGWHISVYRLADGEAVPPTFDSASGEWIATWQTGLRGLDWIEALVATGDALLLGGNGYPVNFAGQAQHLLAPIIDGPPEANPVWMRGPDDILTSEYLGRTVVDRDVAARCSPQDWLIVSAWDES